MHAPLLRMDESVGFFLATRAVLGQGQDDVRIMVGFALNMNGVENAVGGFTSMFGGGN